MLRVPLYSLSVGAVLGLVPRLVGFHVIGGPPCEIGLRGLRLWTVEHVLVAVSLLRRWQEVHLVCVNGLWPEEVINLQVTLPLTKGLLFEQLLLRGHLTHELSFLALLFFQLVFLCKALGLVEVGFVLIDDLVKTFAEVNEVLLVRVACQSCLFT